MRFRGHALQWLVGLAISSVAVTGCAILGPASIKGSRASYNDAIVTTNNQQVLAMIVRMRYGEPTGLLAVSSVTANLNLKANIASEFGIGPDSNFAGSLTPLTAGIAFEENPTVSYVPVEGEKYIRQLLSPLPLDLTVLLLGTVGNSPDVMALLIASINGIQDPAFLPDASVQPDPRFGRIVGLLAQLSRGGNVAWVQEPGEPPSFALAFTGKGALYARQLGELYGLLGFALPRDLDGVVTLPVSLGIGKPANAAIRLRTRSLYELFQIAAASAEVPEEQVQSGLAPRLPPAGAAGRAIRIRGSESCPGNAMIAVKHHGWWYFIDGTDTASKLTFRILEGLMSVRMAESVDQRATPVLTIPVSR
jgi:hypothetical protein